MNRIRRIRRIATVLVSLAAGLVTVGTTPAFASVLHSVPGGAAGDPPPVFPAPIHIVTLVTGGMPGWQIALIAIGAALLGAAVAVLLYRARTTRRNAATAAA